MTTAAPQRSRVWPWFAMGIAGLVTFIVAMAVPQDAIQGHPKYKTKYRASNWAEYDRALVQRSDMTL